MPTWTADEKTALVNSSDGFSDAATYGAATIYGAFLNEYTVMESVDVGSPAPAFICAAASVPAAKKGSSITINAVAYTVQEAKPDGTGMITLILKKP
jgi:hypothetical protein